MQKKKLAPRVVRDLHQLKRTTTTGKWTTSTVTLICSLNASTQAFIAVAQLELGEKDFRKISSLRKLAKSLAPGTLPQFRTHNQLIATSWFDRRGVYLLSTIHPPKNLDGTLPTVPRKNGDVPCPRAQVDYQKYIGGVDLSDQLTTTFSVVRKSEESLEEACDVVLSLGLCYKTESRTQPFPRFRNTLTG